MALKILIDNRRANERGVMAKIPNPDRARRLQNCERYAFDRIGTVIRHVKHAEEHADKLIGTDYEKDNDANYEDEAAALRELTTDLKEIKLRLKLLILS